MQKYGPDYNRLKSKLGYVRGLFEEGTDWNDKTLIITLLSVLSSRLELFKLYLNKTPKILFISFTVIK